MKAKLFSIFVVLTLILSLFGSALPAVAETPENEVDASTANLPPPEERPAVAPMATRDLAGARILFDGVHGWPGTNMDSYFSILHQDLVNAGATVDSLASPPITPAILGGYDVLMLTEPWTPPTADELAALTNFVANGGGFIVIGDDDVAAYNQWVSFSNINYIYGGYSGVTTDITPHPVTEDVTSLYFAAAMSELSVTGQAVSLARVEGHTQLAASEYPAAGNGRVVVVADEDSIIDYYIESENNRLMAANAFYWLAQGVAAPPEVSPEEDMALNPNGTGYPHPLESDAGWGGGTNPWDIIDGIRTYGDQWARGLAFTGGNLPYIEPCGWRQATINFGEPTTFNRVVVWHHGLEHVPNTYNIQYWDDVSATWVDIFSTTNGHAYLKYPANPPQNWWEGWSTPTENTFDPVTSTKVRFALNNCDITHGWIYEFEVFYDIPVELPPDIWVDPTEINITRPPDSFFDVFLTIGNSGGADLNYEIADVEIAAPTAMDRTETIGSVTPMNREGAPAQTTITRIHEGPRTTPNILIYSSDSDVTVKYPEIACTNLGYSYTMTTDASAFASLITGGDWDLVLIDEPSYSIGYQLGNYNVVTDYINDGGKVIMYTWCMADMPADPVWNALGIDSFLGEFGTPQPVYKWIDHPIWNVPNLIPSPIADWQDDWATDGELVNAAPDAQVIAGFTSSPDPNNPAIILHGNTIFDSFFLAELDPDPDSDGKPTAVELWENQIAYILGAITGCPWLNEYPTSGTVGPDGDNIITVTINTTGLTPGIYQAEKHISSNDPDEPEVIVPVTLIVEDETPGLPDLIVEEKWETWGTTSLIKVAVAQGEYWTSTLVDYLNALPDVDCDAILSTDLATLQQYDVLILYGNVAVDGVAVEQFVSEGGGLITTPWGLTNGYLTAVEPAIPAYNTVGDDYYTAYLDVTVNDPLHPIMQGVNFVPGDVVGYEGGSQAKETASLLAYWNDTYQTVAVCSWDYGMGRSVYLDLHYITSDCARSAGDDVPASDSPRAIDYGWGQQLIHNSVLWAAAPTLAGDIDFNYTPKAAPEASTGFASAPASFKISPRQLEAYNIAVVDAGSSVDLATGLGALGADVTLIPPLALDAAALSVYDLLWIPCGGAGAVDAAGKASEVLNYTFLGGGLIVTQPNEIITPQCLPYPWQIIDTYWPGDPNAGVILDPLHPLTIGLTVEDMPDAFDTSGEINEAYTILALSLGGQPSFGCATYGGGRVIVEMDAPYPCWDATDDNPNLSNAMVERMVSWVSQAEQQEQTYNVHYTIRNQGDGLAPAGHEAYLYIDGIWTANQVVPVDLAPGNIWQGVFTGVAFGPPTDIIGVCADESHSVNESDENNNCLYNTWPVIDIPDLIVEEKWETWATTGPIKVAVAQGDWYTASVVDYLNSLPDVDCDAIFATDPATLAQYDVLIAYGNVVVDGEAVKQFVNQGGGLITTPWGLIQGIGFTQAEPAIPAFNPYYEPNYHAALNVTVDNALHQIMQGVSFVAGDDVGYEAGSQAKPGASVLAHWNDNYQTVAVCSWDYGTGRSVYLDLHYITSDCARSAGADLPASDSPRAIDYGWGQQLIHNSVLWAASPTLAGDTIDFNYTPEAAPEASTGFASAPASFKISPRQLGDYNIAVVDAGYGADLAAGLSALGATVTLIPPAALNAAALSAYDLLWIPAGAAGAVDAAGTAAEVKNYTFYGGGLILTQPNEIMTPQCLPYPWEIVDYWYGDAKAGVILDPTHPLTIGLTVEDMPDAFDTSGTIDAAYTILALSLGGQPSFGCAAYGDGRVIVEMDAPYPMTDYTGDSPCLSNAMVERMVSWVSQTEQQAQTYNVNYIIRNQGTATVLAGHVTCLYIDDVEAAQEVVPVNLNPGETWQGIFTNIAFGPPTDQIIVCADNFDDVAEADEDNNCLTNTWPVVGMPDLIVQEKWETWAGQGDMEAIVEEIAPEPGAETPDGTRGAPPKYRFTPQTSPTRIITGTNVLILSGGHTNYTADVAAAFAANMTGLTFDTYFVTDTAPTLEFLQGYDVVLLYENGLMYGMGPAVGNVVYDYIMGGGNVVFGTFYWQDRSDSNYGQPGWGNLETIDPFVVGPLGNGCDYSADSLDPASIVTHPLTEGVSSLWVNSYQGDVSAKAETTVVASWSDGTPLIGFYQLWGARLVGVSTCPEYPVWGGFEGDFYRIWENALKWAAYASMEEPIYDVHYIIYNQGSDIAFTEHTACLYVDGVEIAQQPVPVDLAPGQSWEGVFPGIALTSPTDEITVCADNLDDIEEANEDNNCRTNTWPATQADWTYMVYLDGDNNLSDAAIDDLNEMEVAGSTSAVNIVALLDLYGSGNSNIYHIAQDTTYPYSDPDYNLGHIISPIVNPLGEVNMGEPQTLINFVTWTMANYPASNYALVIWDHGSGWKLESSNPLKGVCWDETSGFDYMNSPELENALAIIASQTGERLDIIGFDACLMGMAEIFYLIAPYADYGVASEEVEPWDGMPYDDILSWLTATPPPVPPSALANTIADKYMNFWGYSSYHTMSAAALGAVRSITVADAVSTLASSLIASGEWSNIYAARTETESFQDSDYIDLYHFAQNIQAKVTDPTVQADAAAVMAAVDTAVTLEGHGAAHPNAHGMSIYFPMTQDGYLPWYASELAFTINTQWDEFLDAFYTHPIAEPQWTQLIPDPPADQFGGYGPDITKIDYAVTNPSIYFRVMANEPLNFNDLWAYTFLDTDSDPSTGWYYEGHMGIDYVLYIESALMAAQVREKEIIPLSEIEREPGKGLWGGLLRWNPAIQDFEYIGSLYVGTGTDYFWTGVPLSMIGGSPSMGVLQYLGTYYEMTDRAPNQGHAITASPGIDLVVAKKWETWVHGPDTAEPPYTYQVSYKILNQGQATAPVGHQATLYVDGTAIASQTVPVPLAFGEVYEGTFANIITFTPPLDEVSVCADSFNMLGESNEDNNCRRNFWPPLAYGMQWLAEQQNEGGCWGSWEQTAKTGLAVLKFETHAKNNGFSPFDPAYPYHTQVENGLDCILANAHIQQIGIQWHDGIAHNPDTDGDGIAVYFEPPHGGHATYTTGIVAMAIAASNAPDRVVNVPGSPVNGWTYRQVLEDVVNWLAGAQTDWGWGRGGWNYEYMDNSGEWGDQSNSGYATLGLAYAEAPAPFGFGLGVPGWVRSELNIWIGYIQNPVDGESEDGGSGYNAPYGCNILRTGNLLQQMAWVGDTPASSPRVQAAVDYLVRHWNEPYEPGWRGTPASYQATYTVMKGLESLGITDIGGIDWFQDFKDVLFPQQMPDGGWPTCQWDDGERILATEWALLTLQKTIVAPPEKPDLVVVEKHEEWVEEGNIYKVYYTLKNAGNVPAPAGHETVLKVDGVVVERREVPVELLPGDSFFDITYQIEMAGGQDKVVVCADANDEVDELNEYNNCLSNLWPPAPDLVISDKYEEWLVEGSTYEVHYTVTNIGSTPVPAGHDTMLRVDGTVIEHREVPVTLNPGESFFDIFTTVVTLTGGWDRVAVRADDYNVVAESNEMNNARPNTIAWPPKPDLIIPWKDEIWQVQGSTYLVKYQVMNIGNADAPVGHDVRLNVEGTAIETREVSTTLEPGQSFFDIFTTPVNLTGGFDSVAVRADIYNEVAESDEMNNRYENTFAWPAAPDLITEYNWLKWEATGNTYKVEYQVMNIGNAPTPAGQDTTLYVDGVEVEHKQVPVALGSGEKFRATFDTLITLSGGLDGVKVCADNFNEVAESREGNNCLRLTVAWPPKPDLEITRKGEVWQVVGNTYKVTYELRNIGNATAAAGHDTSLTVDGVIIERQAVPMALDPGTAYYQTFTTVVTLSGGTDEITVSADSYSEVAESIEANNSLTNTWPTAAKPDLIVDNKYEVWVETGSTYTVYYTVKNTGNASAPAGHAITLYIDGVSREEKGVPVALAPGESYHDFFATVIAISDGIDEIEVCADNLDEVDELDEYNNCYTNYWPVTVEVESASIVAGGSGSVNVWVKNYPAVPAVVDYGLGSYTINVYFDPAMIELTGVSPGDSPFDSPIFNIYEDYVSVTQFHTSMPGPSGNIRLFDLEFNCLGEGETTLYPEIVTLANIIGEDIGANPVPGVITQTTLLAETAIGQVQHVTDGVVVIPVTIVRVKDPVTGETVPGIPIGSYTATASYDPAGIQILGVRAGDAPFDTPIFNIYADHTQFTQFTTATDVEPPVVVARLVARLIGPCTSSYDLEVAFSVIATPSGSEIPEEAPQVLSFLRGDIGAVTGVGTVNIVDAMWGAQYLVWLPEMKPQINRLNMASVKPDGTAGDKKDIVDCMFIAQKIVGIRDANFNLK